jgi:hypothetical protein
LAWPEGEPVFKVCGALLVIMSMPAVVAAQSIVDAQRVEFTPSPDNSAVDGNGAAIVTGYTLEIFLAGGTTAQQSVNLGKPALDTDGMIRLNYVSLLATPLTAGVVYEAVVQAVGPGGTADSARSNTFSFSLPCSPTISPKSQTVSGAGGSGSTTVTAAAGCAWTAASNATWITISSGSSGTGNGTVSFDVDANTSSSRSGTLTVAGSTFTVTEAAVCSYSISPSSQSFASAGGTGTVTVTAGAGCSWTASSGAAWATITSGASGSGSGSVGFSVSADTGSARSTTLTIAGKAFTINESAPCTFTVSPLALSPGSSGASGTLSVTTQSGCAWTASSSASWATVNGSGSGTGTASYTITANTLTTQRTATFTVAGNTVAITEAALATKPSAPTNLRIIR